MDPIHKKHRQRLFIYDVREMLALFLLGTMTMIFTFTLGLHFGKRINSFPQFAKGKEASFARALADAIPDKEHFLVDSKGKHEIHEVLEDVLSEELHEEVARSGIRLTSPQVIDLPENPKNSNEGATTLVAAKIAAEHLAESDPGAAIKRSPAAKAAMAKGEDLKITPQRSTDKVAKAKKISDPGAAAIADAAEEASDRPKASAHPPRLAKISPAREISKYTLQIGAFPSEEEAKKRIAALNEDDYRPVLKEVDLKEKGKWYRLYLGEFATRFAAQKAGEEYSSQQVIDGFVISPFEGAGKKVNLSAAEASPSAGSE